MKPLTIFEAHRKAHLAMEAAVHFRKGERGIAIGNDYWALYWQRRARQAERFAEWLAHFLEGLE